MRLGLVGYGKQGRRWLEPRNSGGRFTSILTRYAGGPRPLPSTVDLDEFLSSVDAIVVATQPDQRGMIIPALRRGIPVLAEKPLADNWETAADNCAEDILNCARDTGTPLMVAHTWCFERAFDAFLSRPSGVRVYIRDPRITLETLAEWVPHGVAAAVYATGSAPIAWHWEREQPPTLRLLFAVRGQTRAAVVTFAQGEKMRLIASVGRLILGTSHNAVSLLPNAADPVTPMARMLDLFLALPASYDARADLKLTRAIYRVCLYPNTA